MKAAVLHRYDESLSSEGFRVLWYHSTRKAALDVATRQRRLR